MLDFPQIHLKSLPLKSLHFFIPVFIFFYFNTLNSFAQKPHVDASLFKEGLIELKFEKSWRYQPGDSLEWANPNYDDTSWYNIDPIDLKAYQMADSLWMGYGWWRITFTANQKTIEDIERLYSYSWGAAEIFLDGKLVATYGSFSKDSQLEKTYTPNYEGGKPLKITPLEEHTLAVRFSNHQAKDNYKIFKRFSENLGFDIGFSAEVRANYSDFRYANSYAIGNNGSAFYFVAIASAFVL